MPFSSHLPPLRFESSWDLPDVAPSTSVLVKVSASIGPTTSALPSLCASAHWYSRSETAFSAIEICAGQPSVASSNARNETKIFMGCLREDYFIRKLDFGWRRASALRWAFFLSRFGP